MRTSWIRNIRSHNQRLSDNAQLPHLKMPCSVVVLSESKVYDDTFEAIQARYGVDQRPFTQVQLLTRDDTIIWMAYSKESSHPINILASRILVDLEKISPVRGARGLAAITSCLPRNMAILYATNTDGNTRQDYKFTNALHDWTRLFKPLRIVTYQKLAALYDQDDLTQYQGEIPVHDLLRNICRDHSRLANRKDVVDFLWGLAVGQSGVNDDGRCYVMHLLYLAALMTKIHTYEWNGAQDLPLPQS